MMRPFRVWTWNCVYIPRYTISTTSPSRRDPVSGTSRVDRRDPDPLGPDGHAQRITAAYTGANRDDQPLSFIELHDGVGPDDIRHRQLERVQRTDEIGDEHRGGMLVHLARAPDLLDSPGVHDRDPVGHCQCFLLVVRDVHERRAELVLDPLQLQLHLLSQLDVQGPERLVEQERGRAVDKGSRECDALLLAARELPGPAPLQAFELDDLEHQGDSFTMLGARHALDLETEGHVVVDRHVREQRVLLEDHVHGAAICAYVGHVLALQQDPTLVRMFEPCDHSKRCRLATSTRAEQREELALFDRHRELRHGGGVSEVLAHALERDCDRAGVPHRGRV